MNKGLFPLLLFLIILVSCEKETMLTVDQTSLSFTDAGGSSSITLTANKPWSATSNQSWCKVSPSGGEEATSSRISISCDANTTYDARNATVTITCAELTKQISISQATNNGLLVSQTSYELTKAAQQLSIQVQANVKFSVEVDNSCKDWIKYNSTKSLSTSTVVLDIAENKSYDSREGKVTIKQEGGNLSSTVTIRQSQLDGLFITTPQYNLSNEKHTITVEVSTNVEFDVKPEADWVKFIQTKGLNTKQIVLQVEENDTYDQRETKVNVKQKNGDLSGVIIIKQDEKYGILVTQPEYNLSNEAAVIDVEVKYNVDFEVIIPDECKAWIKQVSTKSLDSKTYTFSVAKNETYDNREGSITFKQKKGAISTTVAIKQAQKEGLIAEKTEYIISSEEQQLNIKVKSNIDYEVLIDDSCKDWLSRIQTKGLVEETFSFQVAKNEGETRFGKVVLKGADIQETIIIKQEAEGYVVFEDAYFKAYCVENFDKNGDGEISMAEAKDITFINIDTYNVSSLQGIENMPNLIKLYCCEDNSQGKLTKLDVSNNTALQKLLCYNNQLTSLDVSKNTALEYIDCNYNQLISLDVSNNMAIQRLLCNYNQLTCLNISNTEIKYLECNYNQLTNLDISGDLALLDLACSNNQLTSLDVSENSALTSLVCSYNQLTSLDVSENSALTSLVCSYNQLTSLDVSNNTVLLWFNGDNNQLTSLDVSKNTALWSLHCDSNQLTSLDVSKNTALKWLHCSYNQLTSLDVSNNTALIYLWCANNQLTSLDVGNNTALETLFCISNQLTSLDVSKNTALLTLNFNSNQLKSIDVSNNTALEFFDCNYNQLTSLDVSKNTALEGLYCDGNLLTSLVVSNNTSLKYLTCDSNQLTSIDVSKNMALKELSCSRNQLSTLDVSDNTAMEKLECYSNLLTSLDVSNNGELKTLWCFSNPYLKEVWLKQNQIISTFYYDTDVATIKYK